MTSIVMGILFGLLMFILGCIIGVQAGREDVVKKFWKEALKDRADKLGTDEVLSLSCHVCVCSGDDDDDDDDGGCLGGPVFDYEFSRN